LGKNLYKPRKSGLESNKMNVKKRIVKIMFLSFGLLQSIKKTIKIGIKSIIPPEFSNSDLYGKDCAPSSSFSENFQPYPPTNCKVLR
jgi:hypothetical protein